MSRFNPAWWLFYGVGKAVIGGLEKAGELIDQLSPDEEDEVAEDEEESSDEHEDEEDHEADDKNDDEDDDTWEEERGLRLKDQDWWDAEKYELEYGGDEGEDPDESDEAEQKEDEPESNEAGEPLSDKFGRWAEQKMSRIVGRAARAGLRYVTRADFDEDDEVEFPHDFLACRVASSNEDDFEEVDNESMPEEPPHDRGFESIYDLITPPQLNEDEELENEGWEEDEESWEEEGDD